MKNKLVFMTVLSLLIFSCKYKEQIAEEKKRYDRFEDYYKDNKYVNEKLGFFIQFDKDWMIITNYEQFNTLQKQYAKYFSSNHGEVLFMGFNNEKKMGIRATCEVLGMSNEEYFDTVKSNLIEENKKYKITYVKNSEVLLKNIKAYKSVCNANINKNNIYIFDTIIFTLQLNNFKIDIWIKDTLYKDQEDYIKSIFDNIDIIELEQKQDK